MKKIFFQLLLFILVFMVIFTACKKEFQQLPPSGNWPPVEPGNKLPVANAGASQYIFLPSDSAILNGWASSDADGRVVAYVWMQAGGPTQSVLLSPNTASTKVTGLIAGSYQFRLQVQDNSGAKDDDTVTVIVKPPHSIPVILAELYFIGKLSQQRVATAAATAGTKILFAGGASVDNGNWITDIFATVDIYDFTTNRWTTAKLSQAGYSKLAAGAGNKILFAGGWIDNGSETRVDIYDVSANSWTMAELSDPMMYRKAVVGSENKVFFAGGGYGGSPWSGDVSSSVEIYDASSNSWSTASLSEARAGIAGGTAGNKSLFAGGWWGAVYNGVGPQSDRVDIYDAAANAWSTASLSERRFIAAVAVVKDKIIFAGGGYLGTEVRSKTIDIYDASTGMWSVESFDRFNFLSPTGSIHLLGAATAGNLAVFFPENIPHFIIYDAVADKWSLTSQVPPLDWGAAFITANNRIYIADWGGVWRVQF